MFVVATQLLPSFRQPLSAAAPMPADALPLSPHLSAKQLKNRPEGQISRAQLWGEGITACHGNYSRCFEGFSH